MPIYWMLVAGFGSFAVCLTPWSSAYWVGALLVVTGGLTGEALQGLFADKATGQRRSRKWLLGSLVLVLLGGSWNIPLLLVPGLVGLFALLFSCIARDIEVLSAE